MNGLRSLPFTPVFELGLGDQVIDTAWRYYHLRPLRLGLLADALERCKTEIGKRKLIAKSPVNATISSSMTKQRYCLGGITVGISPTRK